MNEQKKQRLIEKYRYINVEFPDWCDYLIDEFVEKLEAVGFFVRKDVKGKPKVWVDSDSYGNIFAVVGDAVVSTYANADRYEDFRKFFAALRSRYPQTFKADLPPAGMEYLAEALASVLVEHSHRSGTHVSTEACATYEDTAMDIAYYFDWDFDEDAGVCDFRASALAAVLETSGWTHENIEDAARELVDDVCIEVAKSATADYEYLTSDEAVWEAIEANELHLDEDDEDEDYEDDEEENDDEELCC